MAEIPEQLKEHAWKPGQSGNPSGKPVGAKSFKTLFNEAIKVIAEKNNTTPEALEEQLIKVGFNKALKGDYRFYRDLFDRLYGQAVKKTELTGDDGEPIIFQIAREIADKNDIKVGEADETQT